MLGLTVSPDELARGNDSSRIHSPGITHPACSALQIALIDLLASWNIVPSRVVGHSSGEIAAAYCAGKLTREAAWRIAYFRGYVLSTSNVQNQSMIAVGMGEPQLLPILTKVREEHSGGELTIACYNSPSNCTVSGHENLIDELQSILDGESIFCRKLKVQNAYHSSLMKEFANDYKEKMGPVSTRQLLDAESFPKMFSTLTGRLVEESTLDSSHWVASMVAPVNFTGAFSAMCSDACTSSTNDSNAEEAILEIGPHSTLQSVAKEIAGTKFPYFYMASLSRHDKSLVTLLNCVGHLAAKGSPVSVHQVNQALQSSIVADFLPDLPSYPFSHDADALYESRLTRNIRLRKFARHDLFGAPVADWDPTYPRWRHFLRMAENPWLRDHVVCYISYSVHDFWKFWGKTRSPFPFRRFSFLAPVLE
jgi:acyl transferase domain-containing protein